MLTGEDKHKVPAARQLDRRGPRFAAEAFRPIMPDTTTG